MLSPDAVPHGPRVLVALGPAQRLGPGPRRFPLPVLAPVSGSTSPPPPGALCTPWTARSEGRPPLSEDVNCSEPSTFSRDSSVCSALWGVCWRPAARCKTPKLEGKQTLSFGDARPLGALPALELWEAPGGGPG